MVLRDSSIRKSLDEYIKRRIQEVPIEIKQTFLKTKQVWKCENELDFLYGYYVGKIEEGALHYLLKATRASAGGYVDSFEIRGIIEMHRNDLRDAIKRSTPT
ncbi:MAG: hypothetical protein NPMRTHETA2_2980004 [Nitrosopumilales archaeon]|nr:MAG: hypothetical protein NPMRTHETA2_2980004 [Nitrosopumilales archaeon]